MYEVIVPKNVQKVIDALSDEKLRDRIKEKLEALVEDPYPNGVAKIKGHNTRYRIRIGDYRIIYDIDDGKLLILVVNFQHRREVYKNRA